MAQLIVQILTLRSSRSCGDAQNVTGELWEKRFAKLLRDAVRNKATRGGGLGTRISSLFRKVGLKQGEEIQEIRDIRLQIPNFEE